MFLPLLHPPLPRIPQTLCEDSAALINTSADSHGESLVARDKCKKEYKFKTQHRSGIKIHLSNYRHGDVSCVALKSENPPSVIAEAEHGQRCNVAVVSDTFAPKWVNH